MRYIISVLGIIVFLVVVIAIIASNNSKTVNPHMINLSNYSNSSSSVSYITTGPLVGNDVRQAVEITITQNYRNVYILNGYNQIVSNSESLPNIPSAYQVFLSALQYYGFVASRKTSEPSMFAVCPNEDTYQYELSNGISNVSNLWTTECNPSSDGTFDGDYSTVNQLFVDQITNYNTFTQNVSFLND